MAAPLAWVSIEFPLTYNDLEFGHSVGLATVEGSFDGNDDEWIAGPAGRFRILLGGSFSLESGPLVDVVPNSEDATYFYGPAGSLSLEFTFLVPDSSTHAGTFYAPLRAFRIEADPPGGGGSTFADLGPGLFDRRTAGLLGIHRRTPGIADVQFYLDNFDSYPDSSRVAALFGYLDLRAEVPEPASALLTLAGFAAVALRRRSASRRRVP